MKLLHLFALVIGSWLLGDENALDAFEQTARFRRLGYLAKVTPE